MAVPDEIRSVKDYLQLPLVYNHWYVAGLVDEFGQEPRAKTLLERSIVFYRTEAGELTALQNRCLHRSFPLSEGFREGDLLVCRYHGIRYTPDGAVARVPCQDHVPDRRLRRYPVRELGPFVFIWMGDPERPDEAAFPDLPFLADPGYRTMFEGLDIQGSYLLMQENLNDLTHFAYLHKDTLPVGEAFLELPTEVQRTPEGRIWCNRVDTVAERAIGALPGPIKERVRGRPAERWDGGLTWSPGVFQGYAPIHVGAADDPDRETFEQHIVHYLTPETRTTTHYWWSVTNDFALDDDPYYQFMQAVLAAAFREDKWACEQMQTLLDGHQGEHRDLGIQGDRAGMLFRGVMLDWVRAEYVEATQTG